MHRIKVLIATDDVQLRRLERSIAEIEAAPAEVKQFKLLLLRALQTERGHLVQDAARSRRPIARPAARAA
jgi:hypothetical protein